MLKNPYNINTSKKSVSQLLKKSLVGGVCWSYLKRIFFKLSERIDATVPSGGIAVVCDGFIALCGDAAVVCGGIATFFSKARN